MSKYRFSLQFVLLIALLICSYVPTASAFGQNRIRDIDIKWEVYTTDHFEIYYDKNTEFLLERSIRIAEDAYDHISSTLDFDIPGRTPIMIYGSRCAFEQTNISNETPGEGTGGFSEILRHRVVVPYEGSQKQFDHVLSHEITHVFTFSMFFSSPGSILTNQVVYPAMWIMEGLPEYVTGIWDAEAEMVLRDAVLNNKLAPLTELDQFNDYSRTYLFYQEGHSALDYMAETYGVDSIRKLLRNLKRDPEKNTNQAIKKTIDKSLADFSSDWQLWLMRKYYPKITEKKAAREIARPLIKDPTDRERLASYIAPEWSPSGDIIACMSTTTFFPNIFLYKADDGKRVANLTYGYYLDRYLYLISEGRPLTYSPDHDHLAWIARVGTRDRIILYDLVKRNIIRKIKLPLDDLNEICFSPDGSKLAVIGMKGRSRDLYTYDLSTHKLERLTDSPFNKSGPAWSPDGKWIAYSQETEDGSRIMLVQPDGSNLRVLVEDSGDNKSPSWSPDSKQIAYAGNYHDRTGNLCIVDLESGKASRYSDLLVGLDQIRWSPTGERLCFTAYESNHQQVFIMDLPKDGMQSQDEFTAYRPRKKDKINTEGLGAGILDLTTPPKETKATPPPEGNGTDTTKGSDAAAVKTDEKENNLPGKASSGQPEEGSFIQPLVTAESIARDSKPYQVRFEADYAASSFVFTSGGAFQNYTEVALSDMLSNHQLYVLFDLTTVYNISDIDVATQYIYQGDRASYGGLLSSWRNLYYNQNGYFWERNSGVEGLYSYPFTRTERVDLSPFWYARQRDWYKYRSKTGELKHVTVNNNLSGLSLGLTHDNTQWGYFHPTHGERMDLTIQQGVPFSSKYLSFTNVVPDIRKYFRLTERGSFAFRLTGGASLGRDPQDFYLGGGSTLRGYPYYTFYGNRDFLFNFETRFPIVDAIFFPLPGFAIGYFRSLLFMDWGAAWNGDKSISWLGNKEDEKYPTFTPWTSDGGFHLVHSKMSFGTGIRWSLGIADLRIDWAWRTNLQYVDKEPYVHVGLGSEF